MSVIYSLDLTCDQLVQAGLTLGKGKKCTPGTAKALQEPALEPIVAKLVKLLLLSY